MELGPERVDDLLPIAVRREASPLCATDAVLAVELYIQRVVDVTPGADGDADAVLEALILVVTTTSVTPVRLRVLLRWRWGFIVLGLVQLEADLREVV